MLYPISVPKSSGGECLAGFIDVHGQVIVRPSYKHASFFFEGKASVVDENGNSGFLDDSGNLAIPCQFQGMSNFKNGLCSISCGFIDHGGRWFIEPQYPIAGDFCEGKALVSLDGNVFGFIDLSGNFAIRPEFEQCRDFSDGLAAVCRDGRWGYIDHAGEMKIPLVFDSSRASFRHGVAGVKIDGRCGFIDTLGAFVIRPEYEEVKPFSEGCAPVKRDGKWGMIDPQGKQTLASTTRWRLSIRKSRGQSRFRFRKRIMVH
jgi:hypothetical protein